MSENINGYDLLGSGGHVWRWGEIKTTGKRVGTAAISGVYSMVTHVGGRPCRIEGRDDGPAILKASAADKAAADAALNALEQNLVDLETDGGEVSWEDDAGRSGTALVIAGYTPVRRVYATSATGVEAWQYYHLDMYENEGAF